MTAHTGDIIEQSARAVAAHIWDRDTGEAPPWGALTPSEQDAVIENEQAGGIARALASAGLLARPLPTRDEIARAMWDVSPDADKPWPRADGPERNWYLRDADAVLKLLEGDKR